MLIKLTIISLVLVSFSMVLLGIRVLLKANGRFPETHVGHNREMRKRGIKCARKTDIGYVPSGIEGSCSTCGRLIG